MILLKVFVMILGSYLIGIYVGTSSSSFVSTTFSVDSIPGILNVIVMTGTVRLFIKAHVTKEKHRIKE